MTARQPIPLRPDWAAARARSSDYLARAILAAARGQHSSAIEVARATWPDDVVTRVLVERSSTSPATTTTSGWAADVATFSLADFLATLGGASSQLLTRALQLSFDSALGVYVPAMVGSANDIAWVQQGSAIPVRQLDMSGGFMLTQKKLATIFVMTSEMARSPNAENYMRDAMNKSVALSVDNALLGTSAATVTAPAGLRNTIAATDAAAAGSDAMGIDLGVLVSTVSAVSGLDIAIIASPGEAAKIALRAGPNFNFPVLASSALPAKTVCCIGLSALVAALEPLPLIEGLSKSAALVMDTAAVGISTGGTIAPSMDIRSLWQTDSVAAKFTLTIAWALRDSRACAWVQNVNW
jgi:hypothetical protein